MMGRSAASMLVCGQGRSGLAPRLASRELRRGLPHGGGEAVESREGPDEGVCPRPGFREVKDEASGGAGESARGVREAVAEAFGLRAGEFPIQQEGLGPGDEVLGDEHELDPHGVGGETAEGEVPKARVFGAADAVLDAGVAAVAKFEGCDVVACLVGEEHLEAVAVVVGERELCAGVGAFPAADRA